VLDTNVMGMIHGMQALSRKRRQRSEPETLNPKNLKLADLSHTQHAYWCALPHTARRATEGFLAGSDQESVRISVGPAYAPTALPTVGPDTNIIRGISSLRWRRRCEP
jgi:hypothetical protein